MTFSNYVIGLIVIYVIYYIIVITFDIIKQSKLSRENIDTNKEISIAQAVESYQPVNVTSNFSEEKTDRAETSDTEKRTSTTSSNGPVIKKEDEEAGCDSFLGDYEDNEIDYNENEYKNVKDKKQNERHDNDETVYTYGGYKPDELRDLVSSKIGTGENLFISALLTPE